MAPLMHVDKAYIFIWERGKNQHPQPRTDSHKFDWEIGLWTAPIQRHRDKGCMNFTTERKLMRVDTGIYL